MAGVGVKYGSLFSGVGGFDLGFDRAGMECAWQVEYDDKARSVLERHWPDVTKHEDVCNVGKENLEPVDVICGGFPCQDVSVAGKRAGLAGERSGLWGEFHRIIEEIAPRWVVIENVPGLLSSNKGRDMEVILRGLVECRYGVAYRILDSQYFGVAQRRKRVFIVGSLGNGRCAEVLFEREKLQKDIRKVESPEEEIAGTLGNRIGRSHTELDGHGIYVVEASMWDYSKVRRLTPTECERLQGFPDGWTADQSDSARYKQMGNAVTVNVAEWIGKRIVGLP
jgi:DNA (cytosine-5)-methyltransferase 1